MLDDTNDDVSELDTESNENSSPELTSEEVSAAYGGGNESNLLEDGGKTETAPIDVQESEGKTEVLSLDTGSEKGPENSGGIEHIDTRNQELAGQEHPETGVRYEHSTVTLEDGKSYDVVAPQFESQFDVALNKEDYGKSDYLQSKTCNEKLQEAVQSDPDLASRFSKDQLEQIKNGDTPKGYTWHHDVQPGQMQLVDGSIHALTRHTGGRAIWGGGRENR